MATAQRIVTARTSAILQVAGAFDTTPISIPIDQGAEVTLYIDYTQGPLAITGGVQYKVEFSLDNITWYQEASVQEILIVPGTDMVANTQVAEVNYVSTGVAIQRFATETLTVAANWIRFNAKETGSVGNPGTLGAIAFIRLNY